MGRRQQKGRAKKMAVNTDYLAAEQIRHRWRRKGKEIFTVIT